jgi:hypothetical protein
MPLDPCSSWRHAGGPTSPPYDALFRLDRGGVRDYATGSRRVRIRPARPDPAVFDRHDGSCRHIALDERQDTFEDRVDELDP